MKITILFSLSLASAVFQADASSLSIQNLNLAEDAGYALFDSGGTLLPDTLTGGIRVGAFSAGFDAAAAWESGDLAALDTSFSQYGSAFGIFSGFDGGFQSAPTDSSASFSSQDITIWVSTSGNFTDINAEHLIYTFSAKDFPADEVNGSESVIFGVDSGSFISGVSPAGQFGNYSHNFGFGGGSLDGFNTVSVVPEPSAYAAIAGFLALGWVMLHRRA